MMDSANQNHPKWIISNDFSFSFDEVQQLANQLNYAPKAVWFYSDVEPIQLKIILAYWIKGSALVPISRTWTESVKQRLLNKTEAVYFENFDSKSQSEKTDINCFIQTSGTNSLPKIVPISKTMFQSAIETTRYFLPAKSPDIWLLNLPLHHIGGLSILLRAWFMRYSVLIYPSADKSYYTKAISSGLIQYISLVPTQLQRLVEQSIKPKSNFKRILLGGGPVSKNTLQSALNLGYSVVNSFGMSETAAQISGKIYHAFDTIHSVSVGKPIAENQFRITTESFPFIQSDEGLLWLKGSQVFKFYLSDDETQKDGEWFCTGDFARINNNGDLEILMRRTDRIISGGENINPIEIEQLLETHPNINECLITGKPDDFWGEILVALYTSSTKISDSELISWLKSRTESFKIPKIFFPVDELPKISISKLDRKTAKKWVKNRE